MTTDGTLSKKQLGLLNALVLNRSVEAAAEAAGVSKTTAYRWMRDETFATELRRVELTALNEATRSLVALNSKAIKTLEDVIDDPTASAAVRVRAATEIVGSMLKLREVIGLEERIAAIEARVDVWEG